MMDYRQQVEECAAFVRARVPWRPRWGIILGTGQGRLAEHLEGGAALGYADLPHFPPSTTPSHAGRLAWGRLAGVPVLVFQGRFHLYEGLTSPQVTLPVRLLAALGGEVLAVCNAAGGLHPLFRAGDLMLITDHINLQGDNPLVGANVEDWGPRFPDLSRAYDPGLRALAEEVAREQRLRLQQGVYVAVKGPSLETPAETRMLRLLGADAVGMSTVPEVIAAVHGGLKVLGLSVISNVNLPDAMAPIELAEIIATVAAAEPRLVELLLGILARYAKGEGNPGGGK
jgi:purine-nucleoside phosphorylase